METMASGFRAYKQASEFPPSFTDEMIFNAYLTEKNEALAARNEALELAKQKTIKMKLAEPASTFLHHKYFRPVGPSSRGTDQVRPHDMQSIYHVRLR